MKPVTDPSLLAELSSGTVACKPNTGHSTGLSCQSLMKQQGEFTAWQMAEALITNHGVHAIDWARHYLAITEQQGKPLLVRDMRNVVAAIIELARVVGPGETVH